MNNKVTILISHDSRDEKIATEIKLFLENLFLNVQVYVSGRDLIGGQTWIEEIKSRIKSSQAILCLLTSRSLSNNWVFFEAGSGFVEDKSIPILTDNVRISDLKPPLSLLQARTLTEAGIQTLVKDLSLKLGQREPKNYHGTQNLLMTVEKLLRNERALLLKEMLPRKDFAPNAIYQWIYEENCLVFDYLIGDEYNIAIDTYFYIDKTEIQLFGRKGSEDYVLNTMCKSEGFLPQPLNHYEFKGYRLIFQTIDKDEKIEIVADALKDIINRIEIFKQGVL